MVKHLARGQISVLSQSLMYSFRILNWNLVHVSIRPKYSLRSAVEDNALHFTKFLLIVVLKFLSTWGLDFFKVTIVI